MSWSPKLVVRFGSEGVASPTSSLGHLFTVLPVGVIALGAAASLLGPGSLQRWIAAVVVAAWLFLLGRCLRDAWAWLAATQAERDAFRAEVEALRRWTPPRGYAPVFDATRWRRVASALLFAAIGASIAFARWNEAFLVPAAFAIAFVAAGGRDLARLGRAPARPKAG